MFATMPPAACSRIIFREPADCFTHSHFGAGMVLSALCSLRVSGLAKPAYLPSYATPPI